MTKNKMNPPSDRPEDIEMIVTSTHAFMDHIIENITDLGAKIEAERERSDNAHRARMNKLLHELETQIDLFAARKQEMKDLRQRNTLTPQQRSRLELLRHLRG